MAVRKMTTKKAGRPLTARKARSAVRAAKKLYAKRPLKKSAAWKKGGREYARLLGHFGISA
jgi:hypothetical protein